MGIKIVYLIQKTALLLFVSFYISSLYATQNDSIEYNNKTFGFIESEIQQIERNEGFSQLISLFTDSSNFFILYKKNKWKGVRISTSKNNKRRKRRIYFLGKRLKSEKYDSVMNLFISVGEVKCNDAVNSFDRVYFILRELDRKKYGSFDTNCYYGVENDVIYDLYYKFR